jgi:hypothetical protein
MEFRELLIKIPAQAVASPQNVVDYTMDLNPSLERASHVQLLGYAIGKNADTPKASNEIRLQFSGTSGADIATSYYGVATAAGSAPGASIGAGSSVMLTPGGPGVEVLFPVPMTVFTAVRGGLRKLYVRVSDFSGSSGAFFTDPLYLRLACYLREPTPHELTQVQKIAQRSAGITF